jgi:hypothetical protein
MRLRSLCNASSVPKARAAKSARGLQRVFCYPSPEHECCGVDETGRNVPGYCEDLSGPELLDFVVSREDVAARSLDGALHHMVVTVALLALEAWRLCVEACCCSPRGNSVDEILTCALLLSGAVRHAGDLIPTR